MDFGTLLHMAKKNSQDTKNDGKYYSTKFAPPKKESKEKKLSENIQKFLQKKEQEEKRKQQEHQEKVNQLLSLRDEKSKNKIRKMLKVTKSANRSVLEDAINTEHTAVSMQGPEQPDQDDYGYVSLEANSFYQKYIDKVKDVKEDKGFMPSRPQSLKDLSGTKERVKAAITREIEEKNNHTRHRVSHVKETPSSTSSPNVARLYHTSSKPIYDPEAEKRQEEEERKKRETEKKKLRKPQPPVMDFQALLKLAEKKQHEPVDVLVEIKKKKEPERLMTLKEKQELEGRQRAKEARERRDRERNECFTKGKRPEKDKVETGNSLTTQRMEPNGRIPKLNNSNNVINSSGSKSSLEKKSSASSFDKKTSSCGSNNFPKPLVAGGSSSVSNRNASSSSLQSSNAKPISKLGASSSSSSKSFSGSASSSASSKTALSSAASSSKQIFNAPKKEFPARDINSIKSREFPPRDVQKIRQFPPPDVRRGQMLSSNRNSDSKKSSAPKRRILDDDSEYDSDLDDFIDDGDEEEDYSSHIKAIFGYDKSKYRDEDFDDRNMESNFAQVQREEYISKKIGIKEDLEDMKLEAMEKKEKMRKKRRLN